MTLLIHIRADLVISLLAIILAVSVCIQNNAVTGQKGILPLSISQMMSTQSVLKKVHYQNRQAANIAPT